MLKRIFSALLWSAVGATAVFALFTLATARGEKVNALWLVAAAVGVYLIGYRYYALFIARRVLRLDPARETPAHRHNDGLDYVPTDRIVLFGHHFAAIAGAGPLVGPVLAAQLGYLPSALWLMTGVIFAGAVQDFLVLFISTRRDGRSLGDLIKTEMGSAAGLIAMVGILAIMVILLAVLGLVVVKALADSPWGCFTVFATLPIAVFMGVYGRYLRPGRIGEMSLIGFVLLLASIAAGRLVAESPVLGPLFTFKGETLAFMLIAYGFIAAVLPVWLLLAPRDYLSTFLKIGTILSLALGICFIWPQLHMPAVTRFIDGTGPVFAGSVFPFLFITIACGAVSGFHALVSSGTTPKMIADESQIPFIGYGAMLMESMVAVMALIAACVLEPGVYFAMNSAPAVIGSTPEAVANVVSGWGFPIAPQALTDIAAQVGEKSILSRSGGAPTLAVGMAQILASAVGGSGAMSFWYHFAILFEALFILTTIDAGTRVARFMIQDLVGNFVPGFRNTRALAPNLIATGLAVIGWGWFLYQGVVDPLGGINSLWPLFGIANQMLAAIALTLCTVVLFRMKREGYAFVAAAPAAWLYVCTLTAGAEKIFHPDPRIGFLAHAGRYADALARNQLLAPAKSALDMQRVIFNDYVDISCAALFIALVLAMGGFGLAAIRQALRSDAVTTRETPDGLPELRTVAA
ncbi:carbon starvation CstA family protein [Methylocystis heyeri]|uniref:Carbon starvation protein A n=1 Tax=Methylocystis heyeri TaxID=391905 RepID=A0A6B8KEU2_9HYPH|nr:carbon starvation CstA family protein [Methylocystis heyeri]QGM46984.1 carbon starvation protein A [Methylocystis heyeri]